MPSPAPNIPNRTSDRPEDGDFKTELLALIPFLRAFARSLTGNQEGADDLAQETLVKAWQSRSSFIPAHNFRATYSAWMPPNPMTYFPAGDINITGKGAQWREGREGGVAGAGGLHTPLGLPV